MNILITGAGGFVGRNLTAALQCIKDGKDRTRPNLQIGELYLYDIDTPASVLDEACQKADFVIHMAGVNRPQNPEEFMQGNFGFTSTLLDKLKACGNTALAVHSAGAKELVALSLHSRRAEKSDRVHGVHMPRNSNGRIF